MAGYPFSDAHIIEKRMYFGVACILLMKGERI